MLNRSSEILILSFLFGMTALVAWMVGLEQSKNNHISDEDNTPLYDNDHPPYYFDRQPFIHPKIIHALSTVISDTGDQIISINIYDSQDSNLFFCESDMEIGDGVNPYVSFSNKNSKKDIYTQWFGYSYIGMTESGIHLLSTSNDPWGEGRSVWRNVMLVRLVIDYGVDFDPYSDSSIKADKPRLLIMKLGEIGLGSNYSGSLKIKGNNLIIGEDEGLYAGMEDHGPFSAIKKNKVIKIDIPR